jgi:hypothetical protein
MCNVSGNALANVEKTTQIQETFKNLAHSTTHIANSSGLSRKTVDNLERKVNEDIYEPFYSERLKIIPAADLVKILQDASYVFSTETTKVASDETIPEISKFLLAEHICQCKGWFTKKVRWRRQGFPRLLDLSS